MHYSPGIAIGIIVTFMFQNVFQFPNNSFFLLSLSFIQWSAGTAKSTILQNLYFLLIIMGSGLLAEIRWSNWKSKSHRSLCVFMCLHLVVKFQIFQAL